MRIQIFFVIVAEFVCFFFPVIPANAKFHDILKIVSPESRQVLYDSEIEIILEFKNKVNPPSFKVWLNHRDITDLFEAWGEGVRAVVGPNDGIRVHNEILKTSRDDKGVWFIEANRAEKILSKKGRNRLNVFATTHRKHVLVDRCTFQVDHRLQNAFEAMGYATATDRLWQSELFRRSGKGSLAEILGPSLVEADIFTRIIGYSQEELSKGFEALAPEIRSILTGYTNGFNRRIQEIREDPALLPLEFVALNFFPKDWKVTDVLAWSVMMLRSFDPEALDQGQILNAALLQHLMNGFPMHYAGMFEDLRWINDPAAQTYIPDQDKSEKSFIRKGLQKHDLSPVNQLDFIKLSEIMKIRRNDLIQKMEQINARIKMGSYAWVVSGEKTSTGNPVLYAGPQMGFSVPSIVMEGSIRAAGLNISGMSVPGIPGIFVGRTPHHAWSMQVGHAHTTDFYIEAPEDVFLSRFETINVAGQEPFVLPVYKTDHGPIINPIPYDPVVYVPDPSNPLIAWRYAHVGHEFNVVETLLNLARAEDIEDFGEGISPFSVSLHVCYADRAGNIAYWMTGRDPIRPNQGEYRLPQGLLGPAFEWDDQVLKPLSHARNPEQGFFGGWNNKTRSDYDNCFNSIPDIYGPFHRAHVIEAYLENENNLTFEELRDLALNIVSTESFSGAYNGGGNPWAFVEKPFSEAVEAAGLTPTRQLALQALNQWDGHFVAGGPANWASGMVRAGAWVLMDEWMKEVIRLTFEDELPKDIVDGTWTGTYMGSEQVLLFNVILHALAGDDVGIVNNYNWFSNFTDPDAPQTASEIIVAALDAVMEQLGNAIPENTPRGDIVYSHDLFGEIWRTPYAFRSTYTHVVEIGPSGPVRVESMFPLGASGEVLAGENPGQPMFNPNFFSMTPVFDAFEPRVFPLPQ